MEILLEKVATHEIQLLLHETLRERHQNGLSVYLGSIRVEDTHVSYTHTHTHVHLGCDVVGRSFSRGIARLKREGLASS